MNIEINNKAFDHFPVLESERLLFRRFNLSDAPALFDIRSDPAVMQYMDTVPHSSVIDSQTMINSINEMFEARNSFNWVIQYKNDPEMIGYFGFWRLMKEHCRGEIGYALRKNSWQKGIMSETMDVMLSFAFNQLKLHSIEANVNDQNVPSILLLENFNFKKEAVFRENYLFNGIFLDSVIYSLLESDYQ
jgi:RimJ/RimL family protein N-acetyltransferase